MSSDLFKEGGPYRTKKVGPSQYELTVEFPTDEQGLVGRECTDEMCSPGYFKLKPGTGIIENHELAYCPYCRKSNSPDEFMTKAQVEYLQEIVQNEAALGIDRMLRDSLGLGPSGKKKYGGGLVSLELSMKSPHRRSVQRPIEDELRRDITCPHCGLKHAVFGIATWCPDCGEDIFLNHVREEMEVIEKVLAAVDARRLELGSRVAARDIENALEDTVSIFESVLKLITRRRLSLSGSEQSEIDDILDKKIRNSYQNVTTASKVSEKYIGFDIFDDIPREDVEALRYAFEKRHPITHNLGVVDRKYLDRVLNGELVGKEVLVTHDEVMNVLRIVETILSQAYFQVLFPVTSNE
jgi:hypothetical protein